MAAYTCTSQPRELTRFTTKQPGPSRALRRGPLEPSLELGLHGMLPSPGCSTRGRHQKPRPGKPHGYLTNLSPIPTTPGLPDYTPCPRYTHALSPMPRFSPTWRLLLWLWRGSTVCLQSL